jgi:hypothetical protein
MFMNKKTSLFILVSAMALSMAGCGTSSTNSASGTVSATTGTTGYTTCTTAVTGQAQECMPNLGTYGTTMVYQGLANISNTTLAGAFIHDIAPYQQDNIQASSISTALVTLTLNATENGPEINLVVQFIYAQDTMGISQVAFGGYDTFTPSGSNTTGEIGSIEMQPAAINTTTSVKLTSYQDWVTQMQYVGNVMPGVSVSFNGTVAGSVGLTRIE